MAIRTRAQFRGANKNKHPPIELQTAGANKNGVQKGGGGYNKNIGGGGGAIQQYSSTCTADCTAVHYIAYVRTLYRGSTRGVLSQGDVVTH